MKTPYSPVVVFTYNRPIHTRQVLDALRRNPETAETELYIYSDGPKDHVNVDAVNAVRSFIRGVAGFRAVHIVERSQNWGLSASVIDGVSQVLSQHDRVIVLEDDTVPSACLLHYFNSAFSTYAPLQNIASISAYQYPEFEKVLATSNATLLLPRFSCWGWGTWRDRWNSVDWTVPTQNEFFNSPAWKKLHDVSNDLPEIMLDRIRGKNQSWSILFAKHHAEHDRYCIHPSRSLVENIGCDGSGVHYIKKSVLSAYPGASAPRRPEVTTWHFARQVEQEKENLFKACFHNSAFRKLKNYLKYGQIV